MMRRISPSGLHPPLANYAHATEVPPGARWLILSGQLGIATDGTIPKDTAAQAEICFQNIGKILREGAMDFGDIVRISTFLINDADLADYMAIRDRYVADPAPASTLIVVNSFSKKQFRVEIEIIAAKIDTYG